MRVFVLSILFLVSFFVTTGAARAGDYVGSKACAECHEEEYGRYSQHSKKAQSWESVHVMASDLTAQELQGCYECHTTGYGKGGFQDYASTPELSDVGCESCHGPGAQHAEDGDPASIRRTPELKDCTRCHNQERVQAFGFRPLIHSGAH